MAIQYGPGYNPAQSGSNIISVATWSALEQAEPTPAGTERMIVAGNPQSSLTGRMLARRGVSKWEVPGCSVETMNFIRANMIPTPPAPLFLKNSAYLSPGGLNVHTATGENQAFTIPLHLYNDCGIGKIKVGGWNTNNTAWDIRRLYISRRNAPAVVTENLDTGFVTIIDTPVSVSNIGTGTNPKVTWVGEATLDNLVGDFVLHIEVGMGAELRVWGAGGQSVGYGPALNNTDWSIQKVATLPSSGTFNPYDYSGFSASILPNIIISCENLTRQFVQAVNIGDSIAQGYGSLNTFMGKSGLVYDWARQWESEDLPYIPLQLGWQGYSSIMIRQMFTAIRRELGALPTFLQGATINNWNTGYAIADPGLQNIQDLNANILDMGSVPYIVWLGFGWDVVGPSGNAEIRACYDTIEAERPNGMYGNETAGIMNPATLVFLENMSLDGAHLSSTSWPLFSAANYSKATAFMASLT